MKKDVKKRTNFIRILFKGKFYTYLTGKFYTYLTGKL